MVAHCAVGWWGVLLVEVVLGGFLLVSDGFRWFLLFEGDVGWFQVVCCFSS